MNLAWNALFLLWTLGEIILLLRARTTDNVQPACSWDRGTLRLLWITLFVSITLGQLVRARLGPTPALHRPAIADAALLLLLVGVLLRGVAIATLGRAFSVNVAIRASQRIVQHGLYACVRHPSYSALLLIFLAIGLRTANFYALAVTVFPPIVALLWRIHVEEIALRASFGDDYDDYARRVPRRLLPGLW